MLNLAYIQNPNRFNLLDVVPSENSDIVFDPISYGQYVAGIDGQKFSKGYIDDDHYVGREILNKVIKYYLKISNHIFFMMAIIIVSKFTPT